MFTNVMWATDGSEHADRALRYALQIADQDHAALHVVHVVEKYPIGKVAGQDAHLNEPEIYHKIREQTAQASIAEPVKPTLHMATGRTGEVARRIAEVARGNDVDLIVVGTRGRSPLAAVVLGSITQSLLCIAPCPVLAVPPADGHAGVDDPVQTAAAAG